MVFKLRDPDYIGWDVDGTPAAVIPAIVSQPTSLSEIQQAADLAEIFRYYRMLSITWEFRPWYQSRQQNQASDDTKVNQLQYDPGKFMALRYHVTDEIADLTPTLQGIQTMLQSTKLNTRSTRTPCRFRVKPSVQLQLVEDSENTYTPKYRQWLSTKDRLIEHHGLSYAYDSSNLIGTEIADTTNAPRWSVYRTIVVQFKDPFIKVGT